MGVRDRIHVAVSIIAACFVCSSAFAAAPDQSLIVAAKREGHVTWYTTQTIAQLARPAAEAFQKKYGIEVGFTRGDSGAVALRVLQEHQAGRTLADVVDGTSVVPTLERQGLLMRWTPAGADRLPKDAVDPAGYWVATNEYIQTPVFNTTLVAKGAEPKTFQDLLAPKWKGQMAWASHGSTSGGAGFVGLVLTSMGEAKGMAYLRQLATQKIAEIGGSARYVVDQVVAGEYPIALQAFNHEAVISAAQGAPVQWIPLNPSMGVFSVLAVTKEAPHPNAAKLFEQYLISPEGQQLFRDRDYIPVDPQVPPKVASLRPDGQSFRAIFFSPDQIMDSISKWSSVYQEIFE
jgi:ABC-type Fe3+ transport system substrate-binding protein